MDTIAKIKFLDAIGQPIKGLKHQLWLSGRCISENKTKENGETVLIKRPEGGIIDVRVYDDISSTYESKVKFTLKGGSQNLVVHSPKVMIEGVKLSEKNVSKGDYSRNYHEVKPKETLKGIAEQYHTTVNVLMSLNNIDDPSKIYIGQKLKYPLQKSTTDEAQTQNNEKKSSSTSLTNTSTKIIIVQNGDTLSSIARTTNNSVNEIKSLNMLSTDIIRIGDKLNVYIRNANSASINTNSGQTKSIDSTSAKPNVEQKSSSNQEMSPIALISAAFSIFNHSMCLSGFHDCICQTLTIGKDGYIISNLVDITDNIKSENKIASPVAIILHRTAGWSAKSSINSGRQNKAVAHFYVCSGLNGRNKDSSLKRLNTDGKIFQVLSLNNRAAHMGVAQYDLTKKAKIGNHNTLSIEICGMYENNMWHPVSDNQAKSAACLLTALMKKYGLGFENVHFHEDLCAKTDYEGRLPWIAMKRYLNNPPKGPKKTPYRPENKPFVVLNKYPEESK